MTQGEFLIEAYLRNSGREFVRDRSFQAYFRQVDSSVKTKRPDFMVLKDGMPVAVIEFDGSQHFSSAHWYNKRKGLYIKGIRADDMKTRFCEERRIPLLRIRYDQIAKTERILNRFFRDPGKFLKRHNPYLSNVKYYEGREAA